MGLNELFGVIQKTLAEEGFSLCAQLSNTMTRCHFVLDQSDVALRKVRPDRPDLAHYGSWLQVDEVSHRNQARFNTSYRLTAIRCERNVPRKVASIRPLKLKCDQTEKTLSKKVRDFAKAYKGYLDDVALEEALDRYLGS